MSAVPSQYVTIDAKGRIVLPRHVRDAAGLAPGSDLVASVDEGGVIRLEKLSSRISHAQDYFAKYAIPGVSAVDELIAERRYEADHE